MLRFALDEAVAVLRAETDAAAEIIRGFGIAAFVQSDVPELVATDRLRVDIPISFEYGYCFLQKFLSFIVAL